MDYYKVRTDFGSAFGFEKFLGFRIRRAGKCTVETYGVEKIRRSIMRSSGRDRKIDAFGTVDAFEKRTVGCDGQRFVRGFGTESSSRKRFFSKVL